MSKPTDPVVIRVWKGDEADVFALFPADPADNYGHLCTSYQHIGQHAGADYGHCIANSRPAKRREAAPLLAELRRIGYWQANDRNTASRAPEYDIASDSGQFEPLGNDEIDALCEQLNARA